MLVWPAAASAQQVTGLTATQEYGFTTLKWTPVPNATDYQIERQSVDANDAPVGTATIVGLWQPIRTITDASPTFAESGYTLGGRYQWRVRARLGTANPQPYSERVVGTTQGHWGEGPGASLRTAWEQRLISGVGGTTYTTDVEEEEYTAALDAASDRMRSSARARSRRRRLPERRPVNLFIFGYPKPPDTAEAISNSPRS